MNEMTPAQQLEEFWLSARPKTPGRFTSIDWTFVDAWLEAGIPFPCICEGMEVTVSRFKPRPGSLTIKGLSYCAAEVYAAWERHFERERGPFRKESHAR